VLSSPSAASDEVGWTRWGGRAIARQELSFDGERAARGGARRLFVVALG
jgi:hypothetical protein